MTSEKIRIHALRLLPGQDLRKEIEAYGQTKKIGAGWVATCVGSLTQTHMRFANRPTGTKHSGHFEIVSLVGTISTDGCHLHLCVSDAQGQCTGGHLLYENKIYTTAEIKLCESTDLIFTRETDDATGWKELKIGKRKK